MRKILNAGRLAATRGIGQIPMCRGLLRLRRDDESPEDEPIEAIQNASRYRDTQ
jgi:hypothetical protein